MFRIDDSIGRLKDVALLFYLFIYCQIFAMEDDKIGLALDVKLDCYLSCKHQTFQCKYIKFHILC